MKRFEFSYRANEDMHFIVLFDDNIMSAVERVLGRSFNTDELKPSEGNTGNWFINGWENTGFTINVRDYEAPPPYSSHIITPTKINPILEGLI